MQVINLEKEAQKELQNEKETMAKETIKERIKEIESAERIMAKLKNQYADLLVKDVEDIFYDND